MFSPNDQALISELIEDIEGHLAGHYALGFGISPSAHPSDNYHAQVWARDFSHAAGNYFSHALPEAVEDSLATILRHQRPDGMLPYRIEREYQFFKFLPGFRFLSKHAFTLIEKKLRRRIERPVYEGGDFGGGEDTVPVVLIAAGDFYHAIKGGPPRAEAFLEGHFAYLQKAADFFLTKTDREDGLAFITKYNADWADTIKRTGKLGAINIWWAQALRMMAEVAAAGGREADTKKYRTEFEHVRENIMEKLYAPEGYFKAAADDDRLDTVASIFGAMYLLDAQEAVRVEETLVRRVARPTGFANFDPPYPHRQIFWSHRLMFRGGEYHNHFVWPWVALQNIYVKIKIAVEHPDAAIREQYKKESITDFVKMSKIFKTSGGAPEILHPHEPVSPKTRHYKVPAHFMGSLAGYAGVYRKLKELGWFEELL